MRGGSCIFGFDEVRLAASGALFASWKLGFSELHDIAANKNKLLTQQRELKEIARVTSCCGGPSHQKTWRHAGQHSLQLQGHGAYNIFFSYGSGEWSPGRLLSTSMLVESGCTCFKTESLWSCWTALSWPGQHLPGLPGPQVRTGLLPLMLDEAVRSC